MSRILEISFEGKESSFKITRIERSKLYGSKHRIPVDAQGRECSLASLTRDGRFILPSGGTALLYLEQGEVVERSQLQAVGQDGKVIQKRESVILEISETIPVYDLLDLSITHAYYLEPVYLFPNLEAPLKQGLIYTLPYFQANGNGSSLAFLLGSDAGYFMLAGKQNGFEFIGLAEADLSLPDGDDSFIDGSASDIDFAMW